MKHQVKILIFSALCITEILASDELQKGDSKRIIRRWVFPEDSTDLKNAGSSCHFKIGRTNTSGVCKKLADCEYFSTRSGRGKKPTICIYENNVSIVCCPILNKATSSSPQKLVVRGCGIKSTSSAGSFFIRRRKRDASGYQKTVVGGRIAEPNSWPWMVAILRKTSSNKLRYHCGATLISDRFILSAAHCFSGGSRSRNASEYNVRVGAHDRSDGTEYSLSSIIIHSRYKSNEHYYDIALLKTAKQILFLKNIVPICLPPKNLKPSAGSPSTLTGWGDTSFGGRDSNVLQEVNVDIFSNKECNSSYWRIKSSSFKRGITSNMVCAGEKAGGKDACQGDSGGPLSYNNGGTWNILGIVSFGYGCAQPGFPGVYTRVSSFLDWINSKTK